MKLTVFYNKDNIDFLFDFSPISEEYFIEYNSYAADKNWEPGSDSIFSEKLSNADNILVVLSRKCLKSKWITYVMGYATGKNINLHFYSIDSLLPDWSNKYSVSTNFNDLIEYYKYYNDRWMENATVKIAKKTLKDLFRDITLTAFVEVVKEGDCMLAGIYIEAGFKATEKDKNGVPLICWAARSRRLPMIRLLMKAGADINAISEDRNATALIDAASEDDFECVNFLLQYDPDLEVASKSGQTALTIASGHNNVDIVKVLVEKGAAKDTKDLLGMSALTYAKLQNNKEILEILEEE